MGDSGHIEWLSFSLKERNLFLQEHHLSLVTEAVRTMKDIDKYGGVCMVCIAQALGYDKVVRNQNKLLLAINRAIGKVWGAPSKQNRHNTTKKHEKGYFCTSKSKVAKNLEL